MTFIKKLHDRVNHEQNKKTSPAPKRENKQETLPMSVSKSALLERVEYTIAVPDNIAQCDPIELEVAVNTTLNLNLQTLCPYNAVACCENPEFQLFTPPNKGGTLTITDAVTGTATYKPPKGFIGKECFVIEIACDDSDYNAHFIVCVDVGACACSPLTFNVGEDCTICDNINCSITNPRQPNEPKRYSLVEDSVIGGTATVSEDGSFEFTPDFGVEDANFQVILRQGCDRCAIDIFVKVTPACEPCQHELNWDGCAPQSPTYPLPECTFCNCHCPDWSAVASSGTFKWITNEQGDKTGWTITPPDKYAGTIVVEFTATCYDKSTIKTSCNIDVNHCCSDYVLEWQETCGVANTMVFKYECGTCESGCKDATFQAINVPDGVTVSIAKINNNSATITVVTNGVRDIEFDIVVSCTNKPGACYGHVTITDEYCPEDWVRVSGVCLPTCDDPTDPNCCPSGYTPIGGLCLPLCDPNAPNACTVCPDGFTPLSLNVDGETICVCMPSDECPDGWVHINGLCLPTCEDGICPDGFVCVNGICFPLCVDGNCPSGFVCVGGICLPICDEDGDCPEGFVCAGGVCLPICDEDGNCPEGFVCINGVCIPLCVDGECPDGFTPTSIFVDGETVCVCLPECTDGDCPDGFVCIGGLCLPACDEDGNCPEGFVPQTITIDGVDVCVCMVQCPTQGGLASPTISVNIGQNKTGTINAQDITTCNDTVTYDASTQSPNYPAGVSFTLNNNGTYTLTAQNDVNIVGSYNVNNIGVYCGGVFVGQTSISIEVQASGAKTPANLTVSSNSVWSCENDRILGAVTLTSSQQLPVGTTFDLVNSNAQNPAYQSNDPFAYFVDNNGHVTILAPTASVIIFISFDNANCVDVPNILFSLANMVLPINANIEINNLVTVGGHYDAVPIFSLSGINADERIVAGALELRARVIELTNIGANFPAYNGDYTIFDSTGTIVVSPTPLSFDYQYLSVGVLPDGDYRIYYKTSVLGQLCVFNAWVRILNGVATGSSYGVSSINYDSGTDALTLTPISATVMTNAATQGTVDLLDNGSNEITGATVITGFTLNPMGLLPTGTNITRITWTSPSDPAHVLANVSYKVLVNNFG